MIVLRFRFWSAMLFGVSTVILPTGVTIAQEDSRFVATGSSSEAGCPPDILGIYYAPDKKITFWGNSALRNPTPDGDYVYDFRGKNLQGTYQVTGWFKVKGFQCNDAWKSFFYGIPNIIATLHDRTITRLTASNNGCDPTMVNYDPYSSGSECPPPEEGADVSGGSGSGSGTYYQPGENTGGETVDWGTGQGDGGTSVCGADAVVEYVCIDIFNEETGQWESYSCGYATVC